MKNPVAIEINEDYLKIAVAKPLLKQRFLSDCIVKSVSGLSDKQISDLVTSTFLGLKLKPQPLILCIPRNQVTVRALHLPSKDKKELNQMLELHISRIVPYRKEEIVYNYVVYGTDETNYTKLMLAIIHRDILNKQLKFIEAAGFSADAVYLSSYGVWQWALSADKAEISASELYLALDVDSSYTDFILFNRENIFFTRGIAMKIGNDGLKEPDINRLIGEIRQSLVIFHNEESNKNPLKVYLGGAEIARSLEQTVVKEFEMPLKLIPSPYSPEMLKAKSRALPANVSLNGLSELILEESNKRISFMLPEFEIKRNLKDRMRELTIMGGLVIYLFMAVLLFFWGRLGNQQSYLRNLKDYNSRIEKEVGSLLGDYKRIKFAKELVYQRKFLLSILRELERIMPADITLDSLNEDGNGNVIIKGHGYHTSEVYNFVKTIEDSKYFKDAEAKSTRTKKLDNKDVTNFEIVFKFTTEELAAAK